MKRSLIILTMVLASLVCVTGTAKAQAASVQITAEVMYPEHFNRYCEINRYLNSVQQRMNRAAHDAQYSPDPGIRAAAEDFLADCRNFHAEATNLYRFFNSVPHTTLVVNRDAMNQAAFDNFVRHLRDHPNARGRTYIYDSVRNPYGAPVDASTVRKPSPQPIAPQRAQTNVRTHPAPVTPSRTTHPLPRINTNRESLNSVLGQGR